MLDSNRSQLADHISIYLNKGPVSGDMWLAVYASVGRGGIRRSVRLFNGPVAAAFDVANPAEALATAGNILLALAMEVAEAAPLETS